MRLSIIIDNRLHSTTVSLTTVAECGRLSMIIEKSAAVRPGPKVARNEVKNASFAQHSAHREVKKNLWRPELIKSAAEHKRRAR